MRVAIVSRTSAGMSLGYRRYLERVVPLVRDDRRVANLELFAPEPLRKELKSLGDVVHHYPSGLGGRGLRRQVAAGRPDVVFVPTARWIAVPGAAGVAMVQNMEPLQVPCGGNPPREIARNLARRVMQHRGVRRARRVVAVSESVRDYLVRRWRVDEARIGVVPFGADPPLPEPATRKPDAVRGDGGFIFTAGSVRPARGLGDALEALALLRDAGEDQATLVVGGAMSGGTRGHMARLVELAGRLGVAHQVVWARQLDDAEMGWCYRRCGVFLSTSRAEGLSITHLEALSYGCVVVSTAIPPAREAFGASADYYPPGDAAGLARLLAGSLGLDESERDQRRRAAWQRSARFNWSVTADRTVSELARALA